MSAIALKTVRMEVARCQRAIDGGSPVGFWINRLENAAKRYESCAAILRMQIAAMRPVRCGIEGCRLPPHHEGLHAYGPNIP